MALANYGLEKKITTSQTLLDEARFGCATQARSMHLGIPNLRNCRNLHASNHCSIFDVNGRSWYGLGDGAGGRPAVGMNPRSIHLM